MVSMRLNLADPDQEPSDEQLAVIAKEFLEDVLAKKALIKQRRDAAMAEARATARRLNGLPALETVDSKTS